MENNNQQFSDRLLKQINTSFDFKRLFGTIVSNWYWFVLAVSVALTCGFLYLRYTTPQYAIKSTILIDESGNNAVKGVLSKLDETSKDDNGSTNLYNEMVILRSQDLIAKVIDSLNLNVRYWAVGRLKQTEIYQECPIKVVFDSGGYKNGTTQLIVKQVVDGQFEIKQGKMTERVLYDSWIKRPYGRFKILYTSGPHVNRGYLGNTEFIVRIENAVATNHRILDLLKVYADDGRTSLIDMAYTDNIPQRGVDFMNVLIKFYQKRELESINHTAEKTREFINQRKSTIVQDISSMDSMEGSIKVRNDIINPLVQTDEFISGKSASEEKINELVEQRQALNMLKNQVENNNDQTLTSMGTQDPFLITLITQYNTLVQQKEVYEKNYGPENPYLLKAESDIASYRKRIIESIDKIQGGLNVSIQNSARNASEYETRIKSVPEVDRSLKQAKMGYDVLQSVFLLLYQKGVENEISVYAATNKSRVVTVPYSSSMPIKPVPKNIYGLLLVFALLIPSSILVIKELMNNTVINENDIESLTNIPLIGTIGRVDTPSSAETTIVVGPHIRTGVAEQFRLIRANLEFMSGNNNKKVFVITSSSSGEGKSFISINLGLTMTLAKKRVCIMEFDLRKPKITEYLGLSNEGGISSYLAGFTDLDSVIKASGVHENLYIANCGPIPPNPGELLVLPTTAELIEKLQDMFDVVIIDTAPIGLVSDALILSQYASINLFIVRQSKTVKDQVRMFDVLHKDKKVQNPAIIFNGVLYLKKYGYGYGSGRNGYGAYYGQGYGSGYYEADNGSKKKKKKSAVAKFFTK